MSDLKIKLDRFDTDPFYDGPAQYIAKTVARTIAKVPQFAEIFGEYIDSFMRTDYPERALPALRIYEKGYRKEFESWFINGELFLDVIWPHAIRRVENQELPDTVASALLQQFRRITFFNDVEGEPSDSDQRKLGYNLLGVPGLNELGKSFSVDKSLGFQLSENEVAPLTQIRVNFRVDLRVWDEYLEDQLRTKDDPFEQTLGELTKIAGVVLAFQDDESAEGLSVSTEQAPGTEPTEEV
jgi:hypothetical protein